MPSSHLLPTIPAGKMIPEDKLPIVGLSSVCGTDIGRYVAATRLQFKLIPWLIMMIIILAVCRWIYGSL